MHEHNPHADLVKNCNLLDKRARTGKADEQFAARLDHKGLAFEHADIRRCMFKCSDNDVPVLNIAVHLVCLSLNHASI